MYEQSFRTIILCQLFCFLQIHSTDREPVCFPEFECFSLDPPWDTYGRAPPQHPNDLSIQFDLITNDTPPDKPIVNCGVCMSQYVPVSQSLEELGYRSDRDYTIFHIHGLFDNLEEMEDQRKLLAAAYLKRNVNLIFVQWDSRMTGRGYPQNVSNTRVVAAATAKFIKALMEHHGTKADQIHVVGFSLGAHIAGYVGKQIPNIYRITALDAAQPGFQDGDPIIRVNRADAQHVDAIHTCARPFSSSLGLGYMGSIGHVDFFFNGGGRQPGCTDLKKYIGLLGWSRKDIAAFFVNVLSHCSHQRALSYWIEALQGDCQMRGVKKTSRSSRRQPASDNRLSADSENGPVVGWDTFRSDGARGEFFVKTASKSPFCIG